MKSIFRTSPLGGGLVAPGGKLASVPDGNLFNRAGLPASPFATDSD
jgi:hypothetical protein